MDALREYFLERAALSEKKLKKHDEKLKKKFKKSIKKARKNEKR